MRATVLWAGVLGWAVALGGCVGEPAPGRCVENADCPRNAFCDGTGACVTVDPTADVTDDTGDTSGQDTASTSGDTSPPPDDTTTPPDDTMTPPDDTTTTGDTSPPSDTEPPACDCQAPERCCEDQCVDLTTSPEHCGACGTTCAAGEECVDSNCQVPALQFDWPEKAGDFVATATTVAYVSSVTVPAESGGVPSCCYDFGARSKDFLEQGTNHPDNAIGGLSATLDSLGFDVQAAYDTQLRTGELVMLLDHRELAQGDTDPDGFALSVLSGEFATGTDYAQASNGGGQFNVPSYNFPLGTGEPRSHFVPAQLEGGVMSTPPGELLIGWPFGGAVIALPLEEARLTGRLVVDATGDVNYDAGTLSGYVTLEAIAASFNAELKSARCACAGVTSDVYLWDAATGELKTACLDASQVDASCTSSSEEFCRMLAGGSSSAGLQACPIIGQMLTGQADIDTDGDCGADPSSCTYEALSMGLQWRAVWARVAMP